MALLGGKAPTGAGHRWVRSPCSRNPSARTPGRVRRPCSCRTSGTCRPRNCGSYNRCCRNPPHRSACICRHPGRACFPAHGVFYPDNSYVFLSFLVFIKPNDHPQSKSAASPAALFSHSLGRSQARDDFFFSALRLRLRLGACSRRSCSIRFPGTLPLEQAVF